MHKALGLLTAMALISATAAQAQLFDNQSHAQRDVHVAMGVTLPLGAAVERDAVPRVELSLTRDYIDSRGGRRSQSVDLDRRQQAPVGQLRLAASLERESRLSLNGQPIDNVGPRRNISTIGGIAIGIGVFLVIGAVAVAADPPLNDLFEPTN